MAETRQAPLDAVISVVHLKRVFGNAPLKAERAQKLGEGLKARITKELDGVPKETLLRLLDLALERGNGKLFDASTNLISRYLGSRRQSERRSMIADARRITRQLEFWDQVDA